MKTPWMEMSVRDFQSALASSSPTPGGGTAAAVALGQAAAPVSYTHLRAHETV